MKVAITLKDPDGVYESIRDAVKLRLKSQTGLSQFERDALEEAGIQDLEEKLRKWIEYNEYVTIEFDTDAQTARVLEM